MTKSPGRVNRPEPGLLAAARYAARRLSTVIRTAVHTASIPPAQLRTRGSGFVQPDPLLHALGTGVRREPGRFEHRAARFVGWWRGGELPSFVEDRDGKIGWAGPRRSRRVRSARSPRAF